MRTKKVLFVDDEKNLLDVLRLGLENEPYLCLFASSGAQALKILTQHEIQVIVTDMRMQEMSGLELLRQVRQKYPDIVRIILSGYTQVSTLLSVINEAKVFGFITKPWQLEEDFKPRILAALREYERQQAVKKQQSQQTVTTSH